MVEDAWRITGDRDQAEDLVQSALEKVQRRWRRVSLMDAPMPYVRRVMVTAAISWRRCRSSGEIPTVPTDQGLNDPYARIDQRAQLIAGLHRLPAMTRAALGLRYFEDLSEAETAAAMGVSIGTLKSQSRRGLKRLREVFEAGPSRKHDPAAARSL
ncbi:hypothetical protein GCM10022223_52650 [Kineosporia mesophila]|uniref:RNA polymerase sigma factor 70 region 4 type 2 domain-containing protein n=1 Tax=Kineosporia mesophila TaxID=566012 RepID=A0ABP7ABL8_9ACTN|nr:SigE family RNA polymerase sigma factor [Kineosporia mesophila]